MPEQKFTVDPVQYCAACWRPDGTKVEMEPLASVAVDAKRKCPVCSATEAITLTEMTRTAAD